MFFFATAYTTAQFKPRVAKCNEEKIENIVNREFTNQPLMNLVVSDLTYVRVGLSWHYICVLVDLFNQEIIGYSAGRHKDAKLVKKAFASVKGDLRSIQIFHTDRGSEFKIKQSTKRWKRLKSSGHLAKKDVRTITPYPKRRSRY